jgi:hypothetical protein
VYVDDIVVTGNNDEETIFFFFKKKGVITFFPYELPKNAQCPHELPTRPK